MSDRRGLHAPEADGAVLAEPPLERAGASLDANLALFHRRPLPTLLGRSWSELRAQARAVALASAHFYLDRAGQDIKAPSAWDGPLLVAGHQPELFHPGVWVKNFALHGLAKKLGALPLNLIVDNDTLKSPSLKVPAWDESGDALAVHRQTVPFEHGVPEAPYEELQVLDVAAFESFADRVRPLTARWGFEPMLDSFWQEVIRQGKRSANVGERFAAARRTWEQRWGCHNLEVPLSELCRSEPFAWFACHLLAELPRLHAVYNTALRAYRSAHGLKSRAHPVPDLAAEGDWLEVPLWTWRTGATRRGRLFARPQSDGIQLRMGEEHGPVLPSPQREPRRMVDAWQTLEMAGWKVRSRALTTTLFARLFLGDIFLHGIGGAKYDELTDTIIGQFYGIEPPGYLALSATLRLPFPPIHVDEADRTQLEWRQRDVYWNPQRHLAASVPPEVQALAGQRASWVARPAPQGPAAKDRFRALQGLTAAMRPWVADAETAVQSERRTVEHALAASAVLRRRDYAFCLFPEDMLGTFCRQFL